jgi:hypothetical protein
MYRTLPIIALILFSSCITPLDEQSNRSILWKNPTQLSWKHFKKVSIINDSTKTIARANTGFGYFGDEYHDHIKLYVYSRFSPEKSLVLDNGMNSKILNHEQMHFNIEEVFARKLKCIIIDSKIEDWRFKNFDNLLDSLSIVCDNMHDLYDKETLHGSDTTQQNRWDIIILSQLDSTEIYKSRKIKLYTKRGKEMVKYNGKKYYR